MSCSLDDTQIVMSNTLTTNEIEELLSSFETSVNNMTSTPPTTTPPPSLRNDMLDPRLFTAPKVRIPSNVRKALELVRPYLKSDKVVLYMDGDDWCLSVNDLKDVYVRLDDIKVRL